MDKILSDKVISVTAYKKSPKTKDYGRMNRKFFRAHISGEHLHHLTLINRDLAFICMTF